MVVILKLLIGFSLTTGIFDYIVICREKKSVKRGYYRGRSRRVCDGCSRFSKGL